MLCPQIYILSMCVCVCVYLDVWRKKLRNGADCICANTHGDAGNVGISPPVCIYKSLAVVAEAQRT